jgi:hypothetical protein
MPSDLQSAVSISRNKNYPRVINTTDTQSAQENILQLLCKGLKYDSQCKQKDRLETLALEAESDISQLDIIEQQHDRHIVAKQLERLTRKTIKTI